MFVRSATFARAQSRSGGKGPNLGGSRLGPADNRTHPPHIVSNPANIGRIELKFHRAQPVMCFAVTRFGRLSPNEPAAVTPVVSSRLPLPRHRRPTLPWVARQSLFGTAASERNPRIFDGFHPCDDWRRKQQTLQSVTRAVLVGAPARLTAPMASALGRASRGVPALRRARPRPCAKRPSRTPSLSSTTSFSFTISAPSMPRSGEPSAATSLPRGNDAWCRHTVLLAACIIPTRAQGGCGCDTATRGSADGTRPPKDM